MFLSRCSTGAAARLRAPVSFPRCGGARASPASPLGRTRVAALLLPGPHHAARFFSAQPSFKDILRESLAEVQSSHSLPQPRPPAPLATPSPPSPPHPTIVVDLPPPNLVPEQTLLALETAALTSHTRSASTILTGSALGGALLGFGCGLTVLAIGGMPGLGAALGPGAPQLLSGLLFPAGLSLILLSKAELATGNQYYTSIALFNPGDPRPLPAKLRDAARVVLLSGAGNFVGIAAVAAALGTATILAGDPWAGYGAALALKKATLSTPALFARAMLTNALVNLAIFQAAGEKTAPGKMAALWIPIMMFVAMGLEHSIANMFFFPYALITGADLPLGGVARNLAVVFAGNWVGAALFMAGLHRRHLLKGWARVHPQAAAAAGASTAAAASAV